MVSVRSRDRSLRVCAPFCELRDTGGLETEVRGPLEMRVREAERLGELFGEFNSAVVDGFASFAEIAPILMMLTRTQCALLGVVEQTSGG